VSAIRTHRPILVTAAACAATASLMLSGPVGAAPCDITGTPGHDVLTGTARAVCGLGGNDVIRGKGGSDVICGGAGIDEVYGDAGNDRIHGCADPDFLSGGVAPAPTGSTAVHMRTSCWEATASMRLSAAVSRT